MPSDRVASVAAIPVCLGCALASHVSNTTGLCDECWGRRERRQGGGPLRVVTSADTYHETPLCPAVRNAREWRYWRDESCMYSDLSGRLDKCRRCDGHSIHGFDYHRGTDTPVGHS